MIMERTRGGMRLSEYANNSLSCSQDKQHHELNDRTLDERLHHHKTGHLLGMHGSSKYITYQRKFSIMYFRGYKERCSQKVSWEGAIRNCCLATYWL